MKPSSEAKHIRKQRIREVKGGYLRSADSSKTGEEKERGPPLILCIAAMATYSMPAFVPHH